MTRGGGAAAVAAVVAALLLGKQVDRVVLGRAKVEQAELAYVQIDLVGLFCVVVVVVVVVVSTTSSD